MQITLLIQALKDYGITAHRVGHDVVFRWPAEDHITESTVERLASAYGGRCRYTRTAEREPIQVTISARTPR